MAYLKGSLVSYESRVAAGAPTVVAFQYNPVTITRTLRLESSGVAAGGSPLDARQKPVEDYSMELQFDATDGLENGPLLAPLTSTLGIAPRLAALEMLMEPIDAPAPRVSPGGGQPVPPKRLPFVLFLWGGQRVTPVQLTTLTITETAFDELLNPIQASAQVAFRVIRKDDLPQGDTLARGAADYYDALRRSKALAQIAQVGELGG
jgi:hypothetical protein